MDKRSQHNVGIHQSISIANDSTQNFHFPLNKYNNQQLKFQGIKKFLEGKRNYCSCENGACGTAEKIFFSYTSDGGLETRVYEELKKKDQDNSPIVQRSQLNSTAEQKLEFLKKQLKGQGTIFKRVQHQQTTGKCGQKLLQDSISSNHNVRFPEYT